MLSKVLLIAFFLGVAFSLPAEKNVYSIFQLFPPNTARSLSNELVGIELSEPLSIKPKKTESDGLRPHIKEEFEMFKKSFGKVYESIEEELKRLLTFEKNFHFVHSHNAGYKQGKKSFKMNLNQYADMEDEEFRLVMLGYRGKSNRTGATYLSPANVRVPNAVDWRQHGYVTPVKDQGACGSCWAFSSTGSLEGQHFRSKGKLISLSEQNLVDCSTAEGNNGCNGGLMDNAFQYVEDIGGLDTETSYPYHATEGSCHFKSGKVGTTCTGFVDVLPHGDEEKLKEAVGTVGPVSIAIDASQTSFRFYSGGVYVEPSCSSTMLDHGVLVVGYGVEDGTDYWLVKNSWATTWGDEGFIKMARNQDNQCGVASQASYPLV